jgi:hypothetical protein
MFRKELEQLSLHEQEVNEITAKRDDNLKKGAAALSENKSTNVSDLKILIAESILILKKCDSTALSDNQKADLEESIKELEQIHASDNSESKINISMSFLNRFTSVKSLVSENADIKKINICIGALNSYAQLEILTQPSNKTELAPTNKYKSALNESREAQSSRSGLNANSSSETSNLSDENLGVLSKCDKKLKEIMNKETTSSEKSELIQELRGICSILQDDITPEMKESSLLRGTKLIVELDINDTELEKLTNTFNSMLSSCEDQQSPSHLRN